VPVSYLRENLLGINEWKVKTNAMLSITAEDEVAGLCSEMIRIDSTNYGDGVGDERMAAEHIADKLADVGVTCEVYAPDGHPERPSVLARIEGWDRHAGALLIHGHLDVVPAEASGWTYPPLSGEIADGCVWGRGAVDMKDMNAMVLASLREMLRNGQRPRRDLLLAFVADEEAGGVLGAQWLIEKHRDWFDGCEDAIGEVGGFSYSVSDDTRLYLIETAEKGLAWLNISLKGVAGHGSMIPDKNPVGELADAIARLASYSFPVRLTGTTRRFLQEIGAALNIEFDEDNVEPIISKLGSLSRLVNATIRNTANPTQFHAGSKVNVIPGEATATVDGRFLPGHAEEFEQEVASFFPEKAKLHWSVRNQALETSFDGPLITSIKDALQKEDPGSRAVPYMVSAGTDAKSFARLGIKCVGFTPLRLPPDMDFSAMFHGEDERVPIDALHFGVRVLRHLLEPSGRQPVLSPVEP
jgi:acetylornithine deacetylase/succinyl-diaminopimelate desuccinylase-like protein